MTDLLPNPFIEPEPRFVLDEAAFMAAIEPEPMFLRDPSPGYLAAGLPIVETNGERE